MCYFVYIRYSRSRRRYYVGHTKDLTNRLDEHNSGETISIRNGIPWEVAWFCKVDSKTEAIALENRIKKRGASRFIIDQS